MGSETVPDPPSSIGTRVAQVSVVVLAVSVILGMIWASSGSAPNVDSNVVTGTVTYKGENNLPAGSTIVFIHDYPFWHATGPIGVDGRYQLQMEAESSIPVGHYRIIVTPPADQFDYTDPAVNLASINGTLRSTEYPEIPHIFQTPETSGLTFNVQDGPNEFNVDTFFDIPPLDPDSGETTGIIDEENGSSEQRQIPEQIQIEDE